MTRAMVDKYTPYYTVYSVRSREYLVDIIFFSQLRTETPSSPSDESSALLRGQGECQDCPGLCCD